jgi:glycine cleavage system H protein
MNFPADLLYTASHEWAKIEVDVLTMGLTDYAQSELGDIVFVEMPDAGKKADAGKSIGSIEAVKTVSDIYAPLSGEVIAVNDKLKDSPQLINSDPYGEGWIIRIKVSDMSKKGDLMNADHYQATVAH